MVSFKREPHPQPGRRAHRKADGDGHADAVRRASSVWSSGHVTTGSDGGQQLRPVAPHPRAHRACLLGSPPPQPRAPTSGPTSHPPAGRRAPWPRWVSSNLHHALTTTARVSTCRCLNAQGSLQPALAAFLRPFPDHEQPAPAPLLHRRAGYDALRHLCRHRSTRRPAPRLSTCRLRTSPGGTPLPLEPDIESPESASP